MIFSDKLRIWKNGTYFWGSFKQKDDYVGKFPSDNETVVDKFRDMFIRIKVISKIVCLIKFIWYIQQMLKKRWQYIYKQVWVQLYRIQNNDKYKLSRLMVEPIK